MKKLLLFILTAGMLLTMFGCAPQTRNDDQMLEIYVLDVGYGKDWCDAIAREFEKQDWVKKKYPELAIDIKSNDMVSYGSSKVDGGPKANTIDLFFDEHGASLADKYYGGERSICDLSEAVYNTEVPGEEGILYKDKMLPSIRESSRYIDAGDADGERYYYAPWYIGMAGINYNADILQALGIEVPLTSDQWIRSMETIKKLNGSNSAYPYTYSIIQSKDAPNYFEYLTPVWWAQYNGSDEYSNFYNGIVNGRRSKAIFGQKGRLYTLEIMEEALDFDNAYVSSNSFDQKYMISQTQMIRGEAVYHINGDWFDREMSGIRQEILDENQKVSDTRMMRTPIVSKIVERTPSISETAQKSGKSADDVLAAVVKAVDAGDFSKAPEGVSESDYGIVQKARRVTAAVGSFSSAYVPVYATGKNIAFDFLRFMATDIAHDAYIKATNGASLPFTYNVKKENASLYDSISSYQRVRQDYFISETLPLDILPMPNMFPLARFGGVGAYVYANVYTTFSAQNNERHAIDYYEDTIEYWTDQRWNNALASAGLQ